MVDTKTSKHKREREKATLRNGKDMKMAYKTLT